MSAGASNQPCGVMMSFRLSPLTSPAPMPCPWLCELTTCFTHLPFCQFVPRERRVPGAGELRQHFEGLTVVVEIDEKRELRRTDRIDFRFDPRPACLAGILQPHDLSRKVRDLYDIRVTVAVDIDWEVAEVVDVAAVEWDVADFVLGPVRRLVPILRGKNVQPAVLVEVRDRHRFAEAGIDHVHPEGDIQRTAHDLCDDEQEQFDHWLRL